MAHFAEIDSNNEVLRIVVADNNDVENNGGDQSLSAAEHFKTVCPLSVYGVKWVQTSYNNNFRKQYACIGGTYDPTNDVFISPQPFESWTLDSNYDWQPPITIPTTCKITSDNRELGAEWDEENQRWIAKLESDTYVWDNNTLSWSENPI